MDRLVVQMQHRSSNSYLNGTQPLWRAFWVLYVLGSLVFIIPPLAFTKIPLLSHALVDLGQVIGSRPETPLILVLMITVSAYIVYLGFCSLAVWRCSGNTNNRLWRVLARSVLLLNGVWVIGKAIVAFGSIAKYVGVVLV